MSGARSCQPTASRRALYGSSNEIRPLQRGRTHLERLPGWPLLTGGPPGKWRSGEANQAILRNEANKSVVTNETAFTRVLIKAVASNPGDARCASSFSAINLPRSHTGVGIPSGPVDAAALTSWAGA